MTLSDGFFLGTCEVTNAEWQRVMGDAPSRWTSPLGPVERVSWTEAAEFCRRLSALPGEVVHRRVYRLPSEAEWEYACRAGTTTSYSFGDGSDVESAFEHGWFVNNSGQKVFSPEAIRQRQGQDAYLTARGEWMQDAGGGGKACECMGFARHARECLGVVSGLVLQIHRRARDGSDRTAHRRIPCLPRRVLVLRNAVRGIRRTDRGQGSVPER